MPPPDPDGWGWDCWASEGAGISDIPEEDDGLTGDDWEDGAEKLGVGLDWKDGGGLAGALGLGLDDCWGLKGLNRLTIFWKNPPCPLTTDKAAKHKKIMHCSLMLLLNEE